MPKEKKKQKNTESREQPLSLEALQQFGVFTGFSPPAGSFAPHGPWQHTYSVWVVGADNSGYLQLERTSAALKVKLAIVQSTGSVQHTEAAIECAADALFTPRAWRLESWLDGLDGKPISYTKISEQAVLKDGNLELKAGNRTVTRKVPMPITSNWSLFDVVQRLAGAETQPLSFALLEDLDLVKPDQRLMFRESREIELNGKTLKLDRFDLIGQGVLPWQYWVDDRHRLLVAISGQKAFVFDADGMKHRAEAPKGRKGKQRIRQ